MTMQETIDRGDVMLMYKIMNNMADMGRVIFETSLKTRTRGHDKKLQKYRMNLEVRKNYFTSRAISGWNGLGQEVISSTNINTFTKAYDQSRLSRRGGRTA